MRFLQTIILVFSLSIFGQSLFAQGYDVRFNNINCADGQVYVDIEVKAANLGEAFNLSEQNYRFSYNTEAVSNPQTNKELTISGMVDNSMYSGHHLRGSKGNLVSYNVDLVGGQGYLVGNNWVSVGRISFDVVDDSQCLSLEWHKDIFPVTYVGKKTGEDRLSVAGNEFENITNCELCKVDTETPTLASSKFDVYPNPATSNDLVSVTYKGTMTSESASMILTDLNGKVIMTQRVNVVEGENIYSLRHNTLQAGVYFVQIKDGDVFTETKKFVKLNK